MYEPANDLEHKLILAADDPASRPDFFRALLDADVFIIGSTDSERDETKPEGVKSLIPAGANVSIENWHKDDGTPTIPFFTSLEALQCALQEDSRYLKMSARAFFELTLGSFLCLNPRGPSGKEFFPHEIQTLLETGTNQAPQTRIIQKETKVLFGQPANYPSEMVDALTTLFAKHPSVKAAYLCLMFDPSAGDKPSLVVGLEGEGDLREVVVKEAGPVAADTVPEGEPVDFTVLRRNESGISDYMFTSVKPFYERTWGSKLRSMFGRGRAQQPIH